MIRLIRNEAWNFLECISKVKKCCGECQENVSLYFEDFPNDPDDFECIAMEELWRLPCYKDSKNLYYLDEGQEPTDDDEPVGEKYSFSTEEMVEYYKLLDELYESKRLDKMRYEMAHQQMETIIRENICEAGSNGSLFCELVYSDAADDKKDRMDVYLDYYCGYYSMFDLYCGLITVFDKYKVKLKELKDTYCGEQELLEAA